MDGQSWKQKGIPSVEVSGAPSFQLDCTFIIVTVFKKTDRDISDLTWGHRLMGCEVEGRGMTGTRIPEDPVSNIENSVDQGKILAQGSSEELRLKNSNDRLKVIPKNGFEDVLTKDKVDFYVMNDTINIILKDCFDGIQYVEKYNKHIKEFEILRGDMDDVFLNITGRKLGEE